MRAIVFITFSSATETVQNVKDRWDHHTRHKRVCPSCAISILPLPVLSNHDMKLCSKPIICSNFTSYPLSYATAHIDTFNEARKRALISGSGRGMDPVLWVNTLDRGGIGISGGGLCHSERNGLYFLVPIGQEGKILNYINDWYADHHHQSRQ